MKVDRTYHEYESVRMYKDRGMVKWAPFATAELGSAQRDYKKNINFEKRSAVLEQDEIMTILHWSLTQSLEVVIEVSENHALNVIIGVVKEWMGENEVLLFTSDGHFTILNLKSIIDICPSYQNRM